LIVFQEVIPGLVCGKVSQWLVEVTSRRQVFPSHIDSFYRFLLPPLSPIVASSYQCLRLFFPPISAFDCFFLLSVLSIVFPSYQCLRLLSPTIIASYCCPLFCWALLLPFVFLLQPAAPVMVCVLSPAQSTSSCAAACHCPSAVWRQHLRV
jgi:hypothetical protein